MTLAEKNFRSLRIINVVFLIAALADLFVTFRVAPPVSQTPTNAFVIAIGLLALSTLAGAFIAQTRLVQPASEALQNNPEDATAAAQARKGTILSLVCCESVVLFGLVLKILGVPWNICGIFFAVGVFFMLAWRPRLKLPRS